MKAMIQFVNDENEEGGEFSIVDSKGDKIVMNSDNGVCFVEIPSNHQINIIDQKDGE